MISLLCPTRGRPKDALAMADSVGNTCRGDVELIFYVDDDDDTWTETPLGSFMSELYGPREGIGKAWNRLTMMAQGDILGMCNDDLRYDTEGWDIAIRDNMFADGIGIVFANDGLKKGDHCAFPFVSRRWYETLGYFVPEHFGFFYHDTWLYDLAQRVGRIKYLPDIHITHWHNMGDQTAREARARAGNDGQIWNHTEHLRAQDADKLREAINE